MPHQAPKKRINHPIDSVTPPSYPSVPSETPGESWKWLTMNREGLVASLEAWDSSRSTLTQFGDFDGVFVFTDLMKRHLHQCLAFSIISLDEFNYFLRVYPQLKD